MRLPLASLLLIVLATASPSGTAHGQSPRSGVWAGAGLGYGFARARCDICRNDRDGGVAGTARFGGTVSRYLLLGLEGNGWIRSQEELDFAFGALTAVGHWYPSGTSWFLKGGLGIVAYRVDDDDDDDPAITARSFGGLFGAGYDLRVSTGLSLTPYLTFIGSAFADLQSGGERLADVSLTLIQFGVGVSVH